MPCSWPAEHGCRPGIAASAMTWRPERSLQLHTPAPSRARRVAGQGGRRSRGRAPPPACPPARCSSCAAPPPRGPCTGCPSRSCCCPRRCRRARPKAPAAASPRRRPRPGGCGAGHPGSQARRAPLLPRLQVPLAPAGLAAKAWRRVQRLRPLPPPPLFAGLVLPPAVLQSLDSVAVGARLRPAGCQAPERARQGAPLGARPGLPSRQSLPEGGCRRRSGAGSCGRGGAQERLLRSAAAPPCGRPVLRPGHAPRAVPPPRAASAPGREPSRLLHRSSATGRCGTGKR